MLIYNKPIQRVCLYPNLLLGRYVLGLVWMPLTQHQWDITEELSSGKKPLSSWRWRFRGLILSEFHSWNKLIFSVPIRGLVLWCFNDISTWINVLHRIALPFTNTERVPKWLSDSLSSIDFTAAIFRRWGNCILSAYWKSLVKAVNGHGLIQLPRFSLVAVLVFLFCFSIHWVWLLQGGVGVMTLLCVHRYHKFTTVISHSWQR